MTHYTILTIKQQVLEHAFVVGRAYLETCISRSSPRPTGRLGRGIHPPHSSPLRRLQRLASQRLRRFDLGVRAYAVNFVVVPPLTLDELQSELP